MRIAFLWDGITEHYGKRFTDGLYLALKRLEETETIGYFEPTDLDGITAFKPDRLLYWGALCENTRPLVVTYPWKKAICFAGGPIEPGNVDGFDLYFTESSINELEFQSFGKPYKRAFGINEQLFKPGNQPKEFDGIFWGTFAKWKRPELFAPALQENGVAIGLFQDHEKECYQVCQQWGCLTMNEKPKETVIEYIQKSRSAVNPANYWGGGQRMTLEAMACNVPPIVMSDSLKNREYIEESGYGFIVDPNPESIKEAVEKAKAIEKHTGRDYIESKWTSKHYAEALKEGLYAI